MKRTYITYNRETLYKEVWKEPMIVVAKRYGISDVALNKTCRKLKIPTPGNGYWARVRAGYKVELPQLPDYDGPQELTTTHIKYSDKEKKEGKKNKDEQKSHTNPIQEKVMNAYESILNDTETLSTYHSFVLMAEKALRKQKILPSNPFKKAFDITVTDSSLDRVLKIVNIVFRIILMLGYKIDFNPKDMKSNVNVIIEGECIRIKFKEFSKVINHVLTAEDKKHKLGHSIPIYDFLPTGNLAIIITGSFGKEYTIRDSNKNTIENSIVRFILRLIDFALRIKQRQKEIDIRNEEFHQQWIARENQKRLEKEELDRVMELETAAMDWYHSQIIKDFVHSVETKMKSSRLSLEENFEHKEWLKWASEKADWLNPVINKEDPILGKRRKKSLFNINDHKST